jgi:hypothetical protein
LTQSAVLPLVRLVAGGAEVRVQRLGDQRRQRHFLLDGLVLDPLDQPGRQVHVELLHVLVAHD